MTLIWHLITPEYPPQPGGVSDYTHLIANELAATGDQVHVWCPSLECGYSSPLSRERAPFRTSGETDNQCGDSSHSTVLVHRDLGRFGNSDLRRAGRMLDQFKTPRRLLVQWVPHGYGFRSMNLGLCRWLRRRARKGDKVEILMHEPFLSFREGSWRQSGVAFVHRLMAMILLRAASRIWMTIPAWESRLRPYASSRALQFNWLPVTSNIPVIENPEGVRAIRTRYTNGSGVLVGHFGTCDRHTTALLLKAVPQLMQNGKPQVMLLLGRGSELMRAELIKKQPELADRIQATGELDAADLSLHLSACDLMLHPYIDGVSSRRTSTMVALAHGVPVVTTSGSLTEPLWAKSEAVALAPVDDVSALVRATQRLLPDRPARERMSAAARSLYSERFEVKRIIACLRENR